MGIVQTPKILGYIPNLFEGRRKKSREDFEHIKGEFTDGEIFEPFFNIIFSLFILPLSFSNIFNII